MKRALARIGSTAAVALFVAAAAATNPPGSPADHFLAYKTKATKGGPAFAPIVSIRLADRFEDAVFFDAVKVGDLRIPAAKDSEAPTDPLTYLQAYTIKASKACSNDGQPCAKAADCGPGAKCKRPAHAKHPRESMVDAFGAWAIDVGKPSLLLVPSLASLTGVPSAPDPASHDVDHFKCYKAAISKGTAGLPKGTSVLLGDLLTAPPKLFSITTLTHLCTPVEKNGEPVESSTGHLLCYKAKPAKKQPKHVKRSGVGVNNQFGALVHDTVSENGLCMPAVSAAVAPTFGGTPTPSGATATPAATATPMGPPTATASLPPDPMSVAPPVDANVATTVFDSTAFLYTGPNAIQTGVVAGTIDPVRAAVVRGKVLDRNGAALPGVRISILSHPEFGETQSRADGVFDLSVNGGGTLTVNYEKPGRLPAQRQVAVPLQDFVTVPDVALIALDSRVTRIDLGAGTMQVAQGNPVTDSDGTRTATLLFPAGMAASMVMPDGSTQPLSALDVRATEYTVGANGPSAMPGGLPPESGYTYAVELSADEAIAAGATSVTFDQPLFSYVDNFLAFPVGSIVPAGYYDRTRGVWVASANGRVIKIVGVTGGVATVDTVGTGGQPPLALGTEERQRLAQLYPVGRELWRVPITHFTPWDCNWPYGPPSDADGPNLRDKKTRDPDDDCDEEGSIIRCLSQSLAEEVPVTGTPFRLRYDSDRAPGRKAAFTLDVPISGPSVPASLRRIDVEMFVAGRRIAQTFSAAANQRLSFTWDGKDAYGRDVRSAAAVVRVGHVYGAVYQQPAQVAQSFARLSGIPIAGSRTRQEVTLFQEFTRLLGIVPAPVGGWSLSPHHTYHPAAKVLLLGDGTRRDAEATGPIVTSVAGTVFDGFSGDGGPATQAQLSAAARVAVAPDGSFYVADTRFNNRVRRVGPDGVITTFAGNGAFMFSGDNGPATQAGLFASNIALGVDGSLYIADNGNHRIRRVGTDGIITTVAGNGTAGDGGDGGPATQAQLNNPIGLATAADGSLYVGEFNGHRLRRIGPDGIITTVAGTGISGFSGDGGPAVNASLSGPQGVSVAPDGSIVIAEVGNNRIRRIGLDGIIETVAGGGMGPLGSGDGGPATQARLSNPLSAVVASDGNLYVADFANARVRRVRPDGIITNFAGIPNFIGFPIALGGTAAGTPLVGPNDVALGPDGRVYIAGGFDPRVFRVGSSLPGFSGGDLAIPSDDGDQLYRFDANGRHLQTVNALTGAVRYQFAYDADGRFTGVTDGDGNVTTIERDANGDPSAVVAPGGQRTTLTVDAAGRLASIADPSSEARQFAYTADGLLTAKTDARDNLHEFTYDALGRLVRDDDPAGGVKTLSRVETADGYEVTLTTGLGRTSTYTLEALPTGNIRRVNSDRAGARTTVLSAPDGTDTVTAPDGTVTTIKRGPDPRFGMLAPVATTVTHVAPGGRSLSQTSSRTATLAEPSNPLSLQTLTDTVIINNRTFKSVYDAATRTTTTTSPEGRQHVSVIDPQGHVVSKRLAPNLAPITLSRDAKGRLTQVAQGQQALTYAYDAANRVVSRTDAAGQATTYAYDAADRVTRVTLASTRTFGLGYDAGGNRTAVEMPSGAVHTFAYTPVDREASYTPPGNDAYERSYNLDRALIRSTLPSARLVDVSYDAAGRDLGFAYPEAEIVFEYAAGDPTRRVSRIARTPVMTGIGQELTFAYDGSQVTGATWSGAAEAEVSYTYDNDFFLTATKLESDADTVDTAFVHDKDGLIIGYGPFTMTRGGPGGAVSAISAGNFSMTLTYDGLGRVTARRQTIGGQEKFHAQFTYDVTGQVVRRIETVAGVTRTYDYEYDVDGQLKQVSRDAAIVERYSYDANGNRTSRQLDADPPEAASSDGQDRLLEQGGVTYEFDADGFLAERGLDAFVYSARGELMSATISGQTVEYSYDGIGRRVARTASTGHTQYFYGDPGNAFLLTAVRDPAGVLTTLFYDEAGLLFALEREGSRFFVATDQVGTPRLVTDTSGQVVKTLEVDTFGNRISDSNPSFDVPIGFGGGLGDSLTRLVRFGLRDYDPRVGRWTARDPIRFAGSQGNLFGYVNNDPVNLRDPLGLFCIGASAYLLIGGGAEFCYEDGDFSVCGELGLGAGAKVVANSGDVKENGTEGFAEAKAKCGPAGAGAGITLDDSGCVDFKVKADLGPLTLEGGDVGAKKNLKVSEDAASPGCGIQAKIGFKVCGGTK